MAVGVGTTHHGTAMLILPDSSQRSRKLLDEEIANRFHITMLVIGDGEGMDVIASKCDVRAQAMAAARRVVWVRDPRVLTERERERYTNGGRSVVVALDLDDQPATFLDRTEANSFTDIELAFLSAQQGGAAA